MLSIKVIKAGSEDYYLDLADGDYYLKGGEPPGKWLGSGCGFFGLSGTVERDEFKRIFNGFHPRSEPGPPDPPLPKALVENAGKKKRRAGFDLTLSAPKSVSVLWSQASPEMRQRIEELHDKAVEDTLSFAEQTVAYSRTGKAGSGQAVAVKLVAANFQHGTSRADDPQLHSHLLVMNVGVDNFDKTRSIESKPIFRNKMLLGAIYRSHLAHSLHREFGFHAERKGDSFEIQGVPDEVIQKHSTRRKQILARLKEEGKSGAVAAAHATLATREKKKHRPRSELIPEWRKENEELGFTDKTLQALVCPVNVNYDRYINKILKEAFKNIQRRLTHFTAHSFLREVLYVAPEYGVLPDALYEPVHQFLRDSPEIVTIPMLDGSTRFAATSVLTQELKMLESLGKLHGREGSRVEDKILNQVLEKNEYLNDEQRDAVRHITQHEHAIRIVQGYAGTGKTTMLRTAVQAWQKAGYNVVGACYTGVAAENLQEEIGVPCDTIHMTLADLEGGLIDSARRRIKHAGKQLVRAALKKKTYGYQKPQRPDISKKSIVLLDEAGMINTRHMLMLMEWVEENGATLVLTGDAAQLPAVEGGSPFLSLSKRVGYAEMTEIKRQQDDWARAAAIHFAHGEIAEGMALYDKRNLVKVDDDLDDALHRLVKDWADHVWDCPHEARILTPTNDQTHAANQLAQAELIKRRVIDPSSSRTIEDIGDKSGPPYVSSVHVGDRVMFTATNRRYKFRNGHSGRVVKFIRMGKTRRRGLRVKLDSGRIIEVPLSFRHIRLGYASTVGKTQGGTFAETFVLLGGGMLNKPMSYVQGTRSRWATHFYTERWLYDQCQDIEDSLLVNQMEQDVELSLAVDLFVPPTATADVADADALLAELLRKWKACADEGRDRSLIVAKDDADAHRINEECHRIRFAMAQTDWEKRHGHPHIASHSAMPTFQHDDKTLVVGDRLRILTSTHASGLVRNDFATVTTTAPDRIDLKLDRNDKIVSLAKDKLPPFDWGYAMNYEQAVKLPRAFNDTFLLQPDKFRRSELQPEYSTNIDYFRWQPSAVQQPTIFSPPVFSLSDYKLPTPPQNTWTYITPEHTQRAAAWHHQVYQANQHACWQAHQLQQTTHISVDRSMELKLKI